jgi:hypothetical protein
MERPLDKRTKAYKEWVERYGELGNKVEKFTTATGIKKAVKFLAGEDCGCDERKEKLNEVYRGAKCLTEQEYNFLEANLYKNKINIPNQTELKNIWIRVFNKKFPDGGCTSCFFRNTLVPDLKRYFEKYK